jgi:hypothetical protein
MQRTQTSWIGFASQQGEAILKAMEPPLAIQASGIRPAAIKGVDVMN